MVQYQQHDNTWLNESWMNFDSIFELGLTLLNPYKIYLSPIKYFHTIVDQMQDFLTHALMSNTKYLERYLSEHLTKPLQISSKIAQTCKHIFMS